MDEHLERLQTTATLVARTCSAAQSVHLSVLRLRAGTEVATSQDRELIEEWTRTLAQLALHVTTFNDPDLKALGARLDDETERVRRLTAAS